MICTLIKQSEPMLEAINAAKNATKLGAVPVGAVVFNPQTQTIISLAANLPPENHNPLAHAEIIALNEAFCKTKLNRLDEFDLYVTLEPCPMCAGAIAHARIRRLYFGAYDPKGGGVIHGAKVFDHPTCNHKPEVYGGIMEKACADLLKDFFNELRKEKP